MRDAEDFLRQTALVDPRFAGVLDLRDFIREAYHYSSAIWKTPVHLHFVDHGLDHSFHVLRKARLILDQILKPHGDKEQLSDFERAVLTVAALIHDTGMQWDKYAPHDQRIGDGMSRKLHVSNGMLMLESAMKPENELVPTLMQAVSYHSFFGHAGRIGFAHSGNAIWGPLTESSDDDWGLDDQHLRFKLLAAALRLADEIDNGFTRIIDFSRLIGESLDDEALAHWCACYYIDDVRIAQAATGLVIEVYPRIPLPLESTGADVIGEDIMFLLDEYRLRRMNEECQRVLPFLRPTNMSAPLAEPRRMKARKQTLISPPERLRNLIQQQRAEKRRGLAFSASTTSRYVVEIADQDEDLRKALHEMQKVEAAGNLYSSRHVALRSSWHCSRYYQFARLLGDGPFLDLVTRGLARIYERENFAYVIGIGTAGAQLASRLALILGARFDYTFASGTALAEPGLRAGNTDYEMLVELEPNARVLIVDDIISKGTSLSETVARLFAHEARPAYVRAFCLISTGDGSELEPLHGDVVIDSLAIVSGVDYWLEGPDGFCEVCRLQKNVVSRER